MSTIAVVGTFYRRPWAVERIAWTLRSQDRPADALYPVYEDDSDLEPLVRNLGAAIKMPDAAGANPMAVAINHALDMVTEDYVVYLTDDSVPFPRKYAAMAAALDANPEWGAVYCAQDYGTASSPDDWLSGGRQSGVRRADHPQSTPFCNVDHTQVMHRRSDDRWPTEQSERLVADGRFFDLLVKRWGPLRPIPEVLDMTRQLPDGLSSR